MFLIKYSDNGYFVNAELINVIGRRFTDESLVLILTEDSREKHIIVDKECEDIFLNHLSTLNDNKAVNIKNQLQRGSGGGI